MTREELRAYHREYQRNYRRANHDKVIEIGRAYRRRKAAERGPITATCVECGKTFVKTGHFQRCCSPECARLRKNEKERATRVRAPRPRHSAPVSAVCPVCGKVFEAKTVRAKFCSRKCHHVFFNAYRKRPTLTKACPVCGKVFETQRSDKVYCSHECWQRAKYKPVQPHELVCVFCGKPFTSRYSKTKYCSPLCAGRARGGYATLTDFEKAQAERAAAHNRAQERDRNGLTLAQVQAVIDAQDGDPALLYERSRSWTPAQRKYAKDRYQQNHGLFTQVWYS